MAQYVGGTKIRPLTEKQAHTAYREIVRHLRKTFGYTEEEMPIHEGYVEQGGASWPTGPVLVKNYGSWSTTSDWAVVWEGGDYEWAVLIGLGGTGEFGLKVEPVKLATVVFGEPIESFSFGLYRATD